jgi:hypothetical protein
MSNETPAAIDPDMFAAVFSENWDNARYIKSERISTASRSMASTGLPAMRTYGVSWAFARRAGVMGATVFTCVFHRPRMMRKPGGCGCTCRYSCLPALSRARRAAAIRCCKIRPNS